jgi:hypothetical protein
MIFMNKRRARCEELSVNGVQIIRLKHPPTEEKKNNITDAATFSPTAFNIMTLSIRTKNAPLSIMTTECPDA